MKTPLVKGKRYVIRHRSENQQFDRISVFDFMEENEHEYVFSARPDFGTQAMPKSWVKDIDPAPEGAKITANRIIRPQPRYVVRGVPGAWYVQDSVLGYSTDLLPLAQAKAYAKRRNDEA